MTSFSISNTISAGLKIKIKKSPTVVDFDLMGNNINSKLESQMVLGIIKSDILSLNNFIRTIIQVFVSYR